MGSNGGNFFSKIFRKNNSNTGPASLNQQVGGQQQGLTPQQLQAQQQLLTQQQLLAQQQGQQLLGQQQSGLTPQQQQQLLAGQGLQVPGQGLLGGQQSFPGGGGAPLTQAHLLLNQQQQQQQQGGLAALPTDTLSMQNFHGSMSHLNLGSSLGGLIVPGIQPSHPSHTTRPTLQSLPGQLLQGTVLPHTQPIPQPPPKKSGEGWGGRGARLPKIPVPLPSLPPNKSSSGYFSHSFEEVEDDLFLDRIVAVGRGSRRLPNPGGGAPGPRTKRLTRQNGVGLFRRGFSLDSDEYEAETRETFRP